MSTGKRFHVVPPTVRACWISLLLGVAVVVSTTAQMTAAGDIAVLPVIALLLGALVIGLGVVGLMVPRLRGR